MEEYMNGVEVVRYRYAPQKLERLAYGAGILPNIKANPLLSFLIPLFVLAQIFSIIKLAHTKKFSIIHAHWLIPQGVSLWACSWALPKKTKLILTIHGTDQIVSSSHFLSSFKRVILRKFDIITTVSTPITKEIQQLLNRAEKNNVITAPMGIDDFFLHSPPNKQSPVTSIICVGRLVEEKNPLLVLKAFSLIAEKDKVRLHFAGLGPEMEKLISEIERLKLTNYVTMHGHLSHSELCSLLQSTHIIVQASDHEGLGLAVLEGMACGNVPILADYPAATDLVESGENGFIFSRGSESELRKHIEVLLQTPSLRSDMANRAREKAASFSWKNTAMLYKKIYSELLLFSDSPTEY
ncbi:Glycosyltransferase [Hahella chejuensis KCTC 2396]|uniref:Glycosyltransferase n=1 Tax=Hahella chejuensis (strain KCTC 2396) TaxID=349521 RepID=Q2SBM7_HAHCH|nr:Glycosyltransferase [Hahella chejuensis KCTC 2396]